MLGRREILKTFRLSLRHRRHRLRCCRSSNPTSLIPMLSVVGRHQKVQASLTCLMELQNRHAATMQLSNVDLHALFMLSPLLHEEATAATFMATFVEMQGAVALDEVVSRMARPQQMPMRLRSTPTASPDQILEVASTAPAAAGNFGSQRESLAHDRRIEHHERVVSYR